MEIYRAQFHVMGGPGEIVAASPEEATARSAMDAAALEVQRIEHKYSRYREDSIVGRINRAAGTEARIACDHETSALLNLADALYRESDGLFDISSGILRRAWDFTVPRLPSSTELEPLLALVGWERVERVDGTLRLPRHGMEIDFGGFGKEYAADRAAAVLEQAGIRHGYVNLAGDIHAVGPQPDGSAWLIGVQHPRRQGELIASIPLTRGGLATSGDYERFVEIDGKRYCHVLNPRTGYPVSYFSSVSVVAPLTVIAGSHSTIAMLKEARGVEFLRELGVSYLAVDRDGRIESNSPDASKARGHP